MPEQTITRIYARGADAEVAQVAQQYAAARRCSEAGEELIQAALAEIACGRGSAQLREAVEEYRAAGAAFIEAVRS
jgi:hypothetical protein